MCLDMHKDSIFVCILNENGFLFQENLECTLLIWNVWMRLFINTIRQVSALRGPVSISQEVPNWLEPEWDNVKYFTHLAPSWHFTMPPKNSCPFSFSLYLDSVAVFTDFEA